MKYNKLHFAITWSEDAKAGDFTGSYVSEDGNLSIDQIKGNEYRLRANNMETDYKISSKDVKGSLEYLLNYNTDELYE